MTTGGLTEEKTDKFINFSFTCPGVSQKEVNIQKSGESLYTLLLGEREEQRGSSGRTNDFLRGREEGALTETQKTFRGR